MSEANATFQRLPNEADGDKRNTKTLSYSLRGQPDD